MYIKLTLQEKLKDERTSRRMTLAELEKATGIARATLGKYESDKCTDIVVLQIRCTSSMQIRCA